MAESLVETANREADEAEAEAARAAVTRGRRRKDKSIGFAGNGAAHAGSGDEEPESPPKPPTPPAEPPEEPDLPKEPPPAEKPPETPKPPIAAVPDDDDEEPQVFSRPSTAEQVRTANTLLHELKRNVNQMAMGDVIDRLLQITDIAPAVTAPTTWTHGEARYARSDVLELLGSLLLRGCREKLELSPDDVAWRWRMAKNWLKQGQVVIAEAKIVPSWARDLTGVKVIVHVNFREFVKLNSDQKVKRLYHVLRGLDAEAKRIPPVFWGWPDELEHFGPLTFENEVALVNAITRGRRKRFNYQLDLMDEAEGAGTAAD